ncbi:DUF3829 domain-containing protein [Pseudomonas cichorii]|nr:DUF3829 domain-containing protein [Pseudomonas cichorii]
MPPALQLHQVIEKAIEELQERAIPFNQALESPMLELRANQLEKIEERLGRDQHWHTLNFMLMARQGIDQLTELAGNKRLTPDQVQALHHSLLATWNDAENHFKSLPRLTSAEGGKPVWTGIREPAKAWIDTLATLQQHWTAQAAPSQLSSDFEAMGQGYDRVWMRYNLAVRNQY